MGHYATLPERIKAGTIDALLLLALFLSTPLLLADAPVMVRVAAMYAPLLLLEPLLLSMFGRTIGQALMDLRVQARRGRPTPNFPSLLLRYWLKMTLGLFSAGFLFFNGRSQALHDLACHTVVVTVGEYPTCPLPLRTPDPTLAPATQRFAAFLVWYCGLGAAALGLIYGAANLLRTQLGTVVFESASFETFVEILVGITGFSLIGLLGRAGVYGQLPGSRLAPPAVPE